MLGYAFMQKAFLVGLCLALITPCIGINLVLKRLSMMGDALSHTALAGVTLGLLLGTQPMWMAVVVCVIAALLINWMSDHLRSLQELSISVLMSIGIALAAVLSGFVENGSNFNQYLFGTIVSITNEEVWLSLVLSVLVLIIFVVFYQRFFYIVYSPTLAQLAGINVKRYNQLLMILTAICVAIATRIVGALMISSMLVIPIAIGLQLARSYRQSIVIGIIINLVCMVVGLCLSFWYGLKPGGTVVLIEAMIFMIVLALNARRY